MNYELAKELKSAGFPQKGRGHYEYNNGENWPKPEAQTDENIKDRFIVDGCYIPTLSELIEACGAGFRHLSRADYAADTWTAQGNPLEKFILGNGTTPQEAVAHLWLSLQKK